jgi:hypothetical protein
VAEIEFLGGPGDAERPPIDAGRARANLLRRHLPTTIAAGLWAAAAAICVLAPFRALYSEQLPAAGTEGVDGWGRFFRSGAFQGAPGGYHGSRHGVVLVACALVFALLALLTAGLAWSQPRWASTARGALILRKAVPAIAFAVFGITAGTGVATMLQEVTAHDNFALSFSNDDTGTLLHGSFTFGPLTWMTFAAAACALAAALASMVAPPDPPPPDIVEAPPIWAPAHEDDELLSG